MVGGEYPQITSGVQNWIALYNTSLTKIESGIIKTPSVLAMAKIAKALDVSIEDLLE